MPPSRYIALMSLTISLCISLRAYASVTTTLIFNTQEFPPFSYQEKGVVKGPAAEIINRVCQAMAIECRLRLLPWSRSQKEVREGKANAMFVIGWNKKRAQWLYFSPPLMQTEYGFFVHQSNPLTYNSPESIQGYNIGVFGPSNTSRSLEKIQHTMKQQSLNPISITMKHDDIPVFKMLDGNNRGLNSVFSNRAVGNAIIKAHELKHLRYAGTTKKLNYFIGFSMTYNDKHIIDQFNHTYKTLYQQGTITAILDRYGIKSAALE